MTLRNESDYNQIFSIQHPISNEINNFEAMQTTEINNHEFLTSKSPDNFVKLINNLRLSHLNHEEKSKLMEILKDYNDVFHFKDEALSTSSGVEHKIRTTDDIPVHQKNYRYPFCHKEEVGAQIKKC